MYEDLISKLGLDNLLDDSLGSFALADKNLKIIWFNKKFKETLDVPRIKGKTLYSLFPGLSKVAPSKGDIKKELQFEDNSINVSIKLINFDQQDIFYRVSISKHLPQTNDYKQEIKFSDKNLDFQNELQEILNLLIKENSLDSLYSDIISRSLRLTDSSFGFIISTLDDNQYSFSYYDPNNLVLEKTHLEREIQSNLSFIGKWLIINKHALVAHRSSDNIGYYLTETLNCNTFLAVPCFDHDKLTAVIFLVKVKGLYSQAEIHHAENFGALLSFAITSIKTKELNNALESRLLQAQKLETIGKLSSGMAHDFNNLLSSIFGSVNLLKKRLPQRDDYKKLLGNIEDCSIRAKDLTKGLLSYGKPTPKRKELVKPNDLLAEISKVIAQTFPNQINFIKKVDDSLYDILGNPTEIYQILLNLCVNAKEAINGKGDLTLAAENLSVNNKNQIDYPLLEKHKYVKFTVKDNGEGISEDNIRKIFDPYFSTKNKETGSGSGLGLYVTYGIIKAHNGHVEVTSKIGEGTTFDVFIPAFFPQKKRKANLRIKLFY